MNLKRTIFLVLASIILNIGLYAQTFSENYSYNPYDEPASESCTTIMVGKNASTDGSVMTAHSCDSNYRTWVTIEKRKKYAKGEMEPVFWGRLHTEEPLDVKGLSEKGKIPAPEAETFSYLNTAYPCLNEKQLAIGEATLQSKSSLINKEGLFLIEELERIALQRCSTARDAIKLIGALAEKYGYADDGECITIADKKEVWALEIYGTGKINPDGTNAAASKEVNEKIKKSKPKKLKKGEKDWNKSSAIWVAQRIPDDHVGINANISRIGKIDFDNPDYFMYSSDLKERLQRMGLWDGKSELKLYKMVSLMKPFSIREYYILNKLAPSLGLKYDSEELPFSVKPDKKVSPQMMFEFYRETYEGSEWDQVKNLSVEVPRRKKDENGNTINYKETVYPISTFMPNDLRALLNKLKPDCAPRTRTVAVIQCSYSQVIQLRDWLPDEIGGVAYFSFDNPGQSPRIPIYAGETKLPKGFDVCGQWRYRQDAAIWAYRETNRIATINWDKTRKILESKREYFEQNMMERCPLIEKKAEELIKNGKKEEAIKVLNDYTEQIANATSKAWIDMKSDLWSIFARGL